MISVKSILYISQLGETHDQLQRIFPPLSDGGGGGGGGEAGRERGPGGGGADS